MSITLTKQIAGVALALMAAAPMTASAQTSYPSKPVTIIVPFTPGASNDLIARYIAQELTPIWNKQVAVENRPGAGSAIGANAVAKSAPDGHTLLFVSGTYTTNAAIQKDMAFNPAEDLVPTGIFVKSDLVMVVGPDVPVSNMKELAALAKSKGISSGNAGIGSLQDFGTARLNEVLGIKMKRVPYKGGTEAVIDVMGGRVDMYMGTATAVLPFVQEKKLKAIAITGAKRVQSLPDVPTFAEQGVENANIEQWWAIFVPKGTPADVIAKINADVGKLIATPAAVAFLAKQDMVPANVPPAEARKHILDELARWKSMVDKGMMTSE